MLRRSALLAIGPWLSGILGGVGDNQTNSGPTPTKHTVAEAAQILGINPEAVRSRIKRGTLESIKEGGTVYVFLDADQTRPNTGPTKGQNSWPYDQTLVESLQDQIIYLRGQLDAEREAHSEARRIIAALTQRIPELPAASSERPPGAPTEGKEPASRGSGPPEDAERLSSWWQRIFGR
jgi:hypothetical protein